jgi:hypothetical protein
LRNFRRDHNGGVFGGADFDIPEIVEGESGGEFTPFVADRADAKDWLDPPVEDGLGSEVNPFVRVFGGTDEDDAARVAGAATAGGVAGNFSNEEAEEVGRVPLAVEGVESFGFLLRDQNDISALRGYNEEQTKGVW